MTEGQGDQEDGGPNLDCRATVVMNSCIQSRYIISRLEMELQRVLSRLPSKPLVPTPLVAGPCFVSILYFLHLFLVEDGGVEDFF